jgi:hypothetical protein
MGGNVGNTVSSRRSTGSGQTVDGANKLTEWLFFRHASRAQAVGPKQGDTG